MSPEQSTELRRAFTEKYSGMQNAHRLPLVLTEGMKTEQVSLSAQDSQLLEGRQFTIIDIARAFGVPPHMIGETGAATAWGSGMESMNRAFVTYTMELYLTRIEQELNRKLFRTSKYFFSFDRDSLMEGNTESQAKYYRAALGGPGSGPGWMSVDDVRRRKNMRPKGGKCAEVFDPRDMPATKGQTPQDPTQENDDEKTSPAAAE